MQVWEAVEQLAGGEEEHPDPRTHAGKTPLSFTGHVFQVKKIDLIFSLQTILECVVENISVHNTKHKQKKNGIKKISTCMLEIEKVQSNSVCESAI